ncbi:MAG TPA: type I phosphomannose isomerase catalytic subunit, partial [Trueperaceae bacterium]|nr:type I phosphomannose isomerase catalytic subunit [Trueperaceae bacterium]
MDSDGGSTDAATSGERGAGELYPLKLEPLLVERIWGGDRLAGFHGMDGHGARQLATARQPADTQQPAARRQHAAAQQARTPPPTPQHHTPIGESWLLCDDNRVLNGGFAGTKVIDVIAKLGVDLLGSANVEAYGTKLALMAKFLDAASDLSIQVHPDDAYALTHESATGHLGKTEAWYVMEAESGAGVVWGFSRQMTEDEVRLQVANGTLADSLNRVPVSPGDVIVNEAGTVHAVGAGLMLFEIQQSSDLTYRLYDYGRRDAAGNLRELHLDKALAVADLRRADPGSGMGPAARGGSSGHAQATEAGWRLLVDTRQFTLESAL